MSTGRRLLVVGALLAVALPSMAAAGAGRQEQVRERQKAYGRTPAELVPYRRALVPYRRFFLTPPEYRGPSRDKLNAAGLDSVRIGVLAPIEGTREDALGLSLLRGVQLALEEANAAGGYGGVPFEIVARNDQALWGSSSNTLVEFAYVDRVWAVIGSIDSNSTHVALRAALKAELPIVNVGSTDPTITETAIPWIIRTTPDDRQTGYRLARRLFSEMDVSRVAVLRSSDRYGRFGIMEFRGAARRLQRPLAMEIVFDPGTSDFGAALERLSAASVDAIVLWASAEDAGHIVSQARAMGLAQPIFGTDRVVSSAFLEAAGKASEGVEATAWMDPGRSDVVWSDFSRRFRERFGTAPDTWAAYAYDAGTITVDAVRQAGLNRARIMDALAALRDYQGVAGPMSFDTTWNNVASPVMVRVVEGRFVIQSDEAGVASKAPGREKPLRLGVLAAEDEEGKAFLAGAASAAAQINGSGGIAGRPLELVRLAARAPWRDGASLIARLTVADDLFALVGGRDGATAHIAAQIATRRRIPLISSSPEVSLTRAGDPWILRGVPSDAAQARLLLRSTLPMPRGARAILVVPQGREGRERLAALREACRELGVVIAAELVGPSPPVPAAPADSILLWLDPRPALEFLRRLDAGDSRHLLGSLRLAQRSFLQQAAALVDELTLPVLAPATAVAVASLPALETDLQARVGYDLVRVVAAAAQDSDGDPARVLSALLEAPAFAGRTGPLRFDRSGNRAAEMTISTLRRGGYGSPVETS